MSKLSRKWRQRQREQSSPLNGEVTAYLDRLHRNDSGRSRNWNQAPAPGTRRRKRQA